MSNLGSADVPSDLEGIRAAIAAANPDLYRHLALYLQVLRNVLPERVHQACFHLATQVHASRYLRLSRRERLALHRHRHALVRRCCSLLTVEQLEALARQMVREAQQRQNEREQQLLARLIREARSSDTSEENEDSEASPMRSELPPGSVRLDLSPPLQGGTFPWSELAAPFQAASSLAPEDDLDDDDLEHGDEEPFDEEDGEPEDGEPEDGEQEDDDDEDAEDGEPAGRQQADRHAPDPHEPDLREDDWPSGRAAFDGEATEERRRSDGLNERPGLDRRQEPSRPDTPQTGPAGIDAAEGDAGVRQADRPDEQAAEPGAQEGEEPLPERGSDRGVFRSSEVEPPGARHKPQAESGPSGSAAAAGSAAAGLSALFAAAAAATGTGMGRRPPPRRRSSLQMAPGSELSDPGEAEDDSPGDSGASAASLEAEAFLQAAAPTSGQPFPPDVGQDAAATEEEPTELPAPWNRTGLPDDPILLLEWLDGLEKALARRLRNLSHAINVDLLRFGMSRGLLPLNLLDAVLQGQIETMASPANVLRLQLPFGLRPGAPPLQALAILLRQADLEMEEPRLRTCRRRWQQHRQEVRRMAQHYRRLQRRQQAHDAERLWLQDIRSSLPPQG